MAKANINDPASIEQAYPRQAFEQDVGANSDAKATVQKGVRIPGPPDGQGVFEIVRASRHVGELDSTGEALFLAPVRTFDHALKPNSTGYGQEEAAADNPSSEPRREADAYAKFVASILEAVRTARFEKPIAAQDERLKGFHGG